MLNKIPKIVMISLIIVSVIVFLVALGVDGDDPSTYGQADPILYVGYIFFLLTGIAALGGAVVGVIMKPTAAKGIGIGIGGMLVVLLLAYLLSSGSDFSRYDTTEGVAHFAGTLLYTFYILAIMAIGAVIFSGVRRLII